MQNPLVGNSGERINVTCALIESNEKVLVVQRSATMNMPLKWEFPGGKVEPNETPEECIKREIMEELNIQISLKQMLPPTNFDYPTISIRLIPFVSIFNEGKLRLKEHVRFLWLSKNELHSLNWAEADVPVMLNYLAL